MHLFINRLFVIVGHLCFSLLLYKRNFLEVQHFPYQIWTTDNNYSASLVSVLIMNLCIQRSDEEEHRGPCS